ncbi:hypothetical protein HJC23_010717 [Cyclotella cryptica]|uniref:DUF7495 domain-containing protein n=1 Tax=Cyclotella cryptica TaxID=29204 RepID=A0ABD3PDL8_9STRA|eukprot:CCRYP_015435-RB/>CCRYP_015435-RB protein AED:0.03 eAED:0.03 QI:219/1/1/1/0.8/0.83/6/1674/1291
MAERTPNGPSDLLDETPPAPAEEPAAAAYTIDEEEDAAPPSDPSAAVSIDARGQDPGGIGEREPSLITRLSSGAAAEGGGDTLHRKGSAGWHGKESALAEKTSKIMSDYQAYLAEIETEFPNAADGDEVEAERNIAEKRALQVHRYRDHPEGTFPPDRDAEYGEPVEGLYRGWSHDDENRSGIHIDRGVADFEDHPHPMVSVRRGTSRSNKRIRRGLAMVALVSLIIGLSVGISKKRKEMSLPDWDAQLAEAESGSQQQGDGGGEQHPEMGPADSNISEKLSVMYEDVSERFQPIFFDRTSGWKGQTYVEALEFCQEKNQYKESEMRICPYMAICPGGQGSRPLGGHKNENGDHDIASYGGSWVPVIDGANEWVSVGNDNSCVKWSTMNDGGTPDWGSTGEGNEANTRHLVCCDADAVEVSEEEQLLQQQAKEEQDKATEIAMSQDAGMYTSGLPQAGVAPTEANGAQPSQQAEENPELPYKISATKFQPKYFSRKDGWKGTTYRDAVQYCSEIDDIHMICPFEAICPAGLGKTPMGSYATEDAPDMLWVPVSDEANSWVSVTKDQPCLPFKDQPNFGPADGVSMGWTQNIVCCLITDDTQNLITSIADLNEASTTTPATTAAEAIIEAVADGGATHSEEIDKAYEAIAVMFKPLTFDRDSGWEGQTYLEAMAFCAQKSDASGERSICPLAAICPLGKGENPSFGPKDEPNGSWAPISDDPNAWVQVSTVNTCLTYQYINNANPQWGYSGEDNEEITRHIYCCLTELATDFAVEASPADAPESTNEPTPEPTNEPTPQPTSEPTPEPTSEPTPEPTNEPTREPTNEPTPEPTNEPTPEPTPSPSAAEVDELTTEQAKELYQAAEQAYQPLVFDKDSDPSWTGQAYLEALQFCAQQDSRVPCPYTALCPAGPGALPFGGIKNGFSPVINQPNSWVSVGPEGTCQTYSDIYGSPPEWGLTGEGDPGLTQTIVCCIDIEDDKSEASSEAENSDASIVLTENEQAALESFKPQWFGREAGYLGTTYQDALEFCSNVAGMMLCPLMAYCPNGPQVSKPLFLQLDAFDGEQWAPVAVQGNGTDADYIMVGTISGNPTTTCLSYEQLKGVQVPSWGLDGTHTEIKEHILCCNDPSFSSEGVITPAVDEDLNSVPTQTEDSPTLGDGSFDLEGAVKLDLVPVWLDEEDGWSGGSHDDAEAFCKQIVGKSLCPYAAYCPHGPGQPVIGGHDVDFTTEGVQWAPVFGSNNHWVLISQKGGNSATTCMSHADLEGSSPDWGLTGDRPWLKRHIMCCNLKNGF